MIPRFNIKRIKNRLVSNTRWTDYVPAPIQFAQDTLSPGKYVVEVNDDTGYNIDILAFDDFKQFYNETQSGPSFDELYTGVTAFDIQVPADERYDFITFYRDYAYAIQLSSFADDLIYRDDYDVEIDSIPLYVKTKFDAESGYAFVKDHEGTVSAVRTVSQSNILPSNYPLATSLMSTILFTDEELATLPSQDVVFLIPKYIFSEWDGVTTAPLIFENGSWGVADEPFYDISDPTQKQFSTINNNMRYNYEVMVDGEIDWNEAPDNFRVEIEVTPKTGESWKSILKSIRDDAPTLIVKPL